MIEYVDVIDKEDNVIGKVTRAEMRKKNLLHRGTTIYIFNSKGDILITKRTKIKDVYPGLLEIGHGGAVSSGESYEQNAYREIKEEVGIEDVELKYHYSSSAIDNLIKCMFNVYTCIFDGKIIMQEEEVEDYFWISIEKLKEMIEKQSEQFTSQSIVMFKEYLRKEN